MRKFTTAAGLAAVAALTLTGCVSAPFGGVFAEETVRPSTGVTQSDAPANPIATEALVEMLDLASVARQTDAILAPVLGECLTGAGDAAATTTTSDPRVTCAGQLGPLASDLTGGMRGRTISITASDVGALPSVQLLRDKSVYAAMTAGRPATVPVQSAGAWVMTQTVTGTSDDPMLSTFDVTAEISAEITFTADASVDAAGTVTSVAVTGATTTTSSSPKAIL